MSATQSTTVYVENPRTTEAALSKQIKGEIEQRFDSDRPVKEFKVKVTVREIRKKKN